MHKYRQIHKIGRWIDRQGAHTGEKMWCLYKAGFFFFLVEKFSNEGAGRGGAHF